MTEPYKPDVRPKALVKANVGKAAGVSAAALTIMVAFTAQREGVSLVPYKDPAGILTACYGETHGIVWGQKYTPEQCRAMLAKSAAAHAAGVVKCLPSGLPPAVEAMMYDTGYNGGPPRFCGSHIPVLLKQGKLREACEALKTFAITINHGTKDCRIRANNCYGVVRRRLDAAVVCLGGLT